MEILELTEETEIAADREVNVLVGDVLDTDLDLFFGPLRDTDVFLRVPEGTMWGKVLVACGAFSSRGEARRNGWNKPIERGFDLFRMGKKKRLFSSLWCRIL